MPHDHKFRFAAQLSTTPEGTAAAWAEQARRAEDLGYSALLMPDHFGDQLAPVPALAAAAAATSTLRLGSLVFGNDYRHPVVLAKEAATLDVLSQGRFELSLGAGWMRTDYEQAGITYDSPKVRVERFEEAVQVVQGLLRTDGPFSFAGAYYRVSEHTLLPRPAQRPGPPLIIGGGGRRVLSFAARHADIVSINVNLREGTGGPETAPNASPERTREKVSWVREAAGDRYDDLELNALIGFVMITDDATGHRRGHGTPLRHRPRGRPPHPPGPPRHPRRDGRGAAVAPSRVRHLVLVDRVRELGTARTGGGETGRHLSTGLPLRPTTPAVPKTSAGILPFRTGPGGGLEVLLVHPGGPFWVGRDLHAWSVAKGEYGADEEALDTAEREFVEELGVPVPVGRLIDLGEVRQGGGKVVRVWAVETEDLADGPVHSNTFEMEWPPRSGVVRIFPEIDRSEWTTVAGARLRLVRAQVAFLDRLIDHVGTGR